MPIAEGAYKDKPTPHAWMSPKQALIYVENIRKGLIGIAPEYELILPITRKFTRKRY